MILSSSSLCIIAQGFPGGSDGKESACNAGEPGLITGKIPWRSKPTPGFLPGEFHRQGSLAGYRPWGHKELNMTELLTQPNTA